MRQVVLDTASLIIKQRLPAALLRELVGAQTGITFVTLGELTRWATMRQWGGSRRAQLTGWLAAPHAPLHRRGRPYLGRDLRPCSTTRPPPTQHDTWIAACCLVYELPLATLNIKDFRDFAEHEGLVLLGT